MSFNTKKLMSNIRYAVVAQTFAFAVSAVMSLIVPKMLGVEEYAFWQLFLLYGAYVPLLHLGLNDGVYLIHGGESLDTMDRQSFVGQFVIGLLIESTFALLVFAWAIICFEGSRAFVFFFLAVYIVVFNVGAYWGAVCQAANETHIFSKMQIIDKASFFAFLLIGIVCSVTLFEFYIVSYVLARLIAGAYIVCKCRCFFGRSRIILKDSFLESATSVRVGIKLTISYIASIFVLGAPRFVADGFWSVEQFAQLSFAISLMNFFVVFVNQAGMVLFPALRQVGEGEFRIIYKRLTEGLDLFLPVVYVLYFPILLIVQWWLPQYCEGLQWLSILLPACVYNSRMEILSSTALKVLRREKALMVVNVGAAALAIVLSLACGLFVQDHRVLVLSIVVATAGRSIVSELFVSNAISRANTVSIVSSLLFALQYLLLVAFVGVQVATISTLVLWIAYLVYKRKDVVHFLKGAQ